MNNYNGVEILCCEDRKFFNKLINHPKVIKAYEESKKSIDDGVIIDELSKFIVTKWDIENKVVTKHLTQPEKKATISASTSLGKPSTLLVKLIGRIYEN